MTRRIEPDGGRRVEAAIEEIAITADHRVDASLTGERHEVVVVAVARCRGDGRTIVDECGMTPKLLGELASCPLVGVVVDLRATHDALEAVEQPRADDDGDPLVDERAPHGVGAATAR